MNDLLFLRWKFFLKEFLIIYINLENYFLKIIVNWLKRNEKKVKRKFLQSCKYNSNKNNLFVHVWKENAI